MRCLPLTGHLMAHVLLQAARIKLLNYGHISFSLYYHSMKCYCKANISLFRLKDVSRYMFQETERKYFYFDIKIAFAVDIQTENCFKLSPTSMTLEIL